MALFIKKKQKPYLDERLSHIAFIMDGNGRWAQKRGLPREHGHRAGAKTFKNLALYCEKLGLDAMTVYAFSTENWKRPQREVDAIMDLLEQYIDSCERELHGHDVRFCFIGDRTPLRPILQQKMAELEQKTMHGRMTLNIAVNYGARAEICRAVEQLKESGEAVTEQALSAAMYTAHCGDPRISNFLLWQAAYAELYFTDKLWPDLTPDDVDRAIENFYSRGRRYGGL